ncbi:MAG: CotH kinase family protein, partial [Candidatus Poribacteria bacterium]|nr:CotH kinase family protein [Candidatus Poribacteria bacterium]
VEELVPQVIHRGINLAKRSKPSSRLLAMLVMEASPESESADKASSLIEKLAKPPTDTLLPTYFFEDDSGTELFGAERVREYHLELSDDAIKQLHEKPKHYVPATFREGSDVYKNVGVRLKGGYGSFRMLDGNSKAAFTVKFNQFVKDQRFHGLRRIILNNIVQDPSYMCEYIGYSLFRDAGVPAPRIGYATLIVNKKPYGLYVQVEAVTKDFLQRWYSKTNGNLYEGPGDIERWDELDLDSNQGREDRSDLRRLAEAIKEADEDDPWDSLAEFVDIDNFTRFITLEQLLNHWDGYTQTNNYRMYNNPDTMKFEFFPHGADQLFEDLRGSIFREQGGILSRALVHTSEGKERYDQMMYQLLEQVWDEDTIKSRIAKVYQLIRPHVIKSTKGRRVEEFEDAINRLLRFVDARRYVVLRQLKVAEKGNSWRERQHFGFHSFLYSSRHDW